MRSKSGGARHRRTPKHHRRSPATRGVSAGASCRAVALTLHWRQTTNSSHRAAPGSQRRGESSEVTAEMTAVTQVAGGCVGELARFFIVTKRGHPRTSRWPPGGATAVHWNLAKSLGDQPTSWRRASSERASTPGDGAARLARSLRLRVGPLKPPPGRRHLARLRLRQQALVRLAEALGHRRQRRRHLLGRGALRGLPRQRSADQALQLRREAGPGRKAIRPAAVGARPHSSMPCIWSSTNRSASSRDWNCGGTIAEQLAKPFRHLSEITRSTGSGSPPGR